METNYKIATYYTSQGDSSWRQSSGRKSQVGDKGVLREAALRGNSCRKMRRGKGPSQKCLERAHDPPRSREGWKAEGVSQSGFPSRKIQVGRVQRTCAHHLGPQCPHVSYWVAIVQNGFQNPRTQWGFRSGFTAVDQFSWQGCTTSKEQ